MKNVKVLIGNYGSGKSELALNFAMQAAARGHLSGISTFPLFVRFSAICGIIILAL